MPKSLTLQSFLLSKKTQHILRCSTESLLPQEEGFLLLYFAKQLVLTVCLCFAKSFGHRLKPFSERFFNGCGSNPCFTIITTSATGGMHTPRRGYYRLNLSRGTEGLASHYNHWQPLTSGCLFYALLSLPPVNGSMYSLSVI